MNYDLVHPSQSYKFSARLQAVQSCDRPAILRVYALSGHRFWIDRERRDTNADMLAFAALHTGLNVDRFYSMSIGYRGAGHADCWL